MWVVRVALRRPYSFVVLALLTAIFGVLAALNTPTDIFPSLNIPVVSVVWTDNGLLPDDMSGRERASLAPEPDRADATRCRQQPIGRSCRAAAK